MSDLPPDVEALPHYVKAAAMDYMVACQVGAPEREMPARIRLYEAIEKYGATALTAAQAVERESCALWCASHVMSDTTGGRVWMEVKPDRMAHHAGTDYAAGLRALSSPPAAVAPVDGGA